jgi:hypothetical protein
MKNVFRISGVILLFFIIHSCKKDNFAIEESYQCGIIGYILLLGDPGYIAGQTQGLIAAPYNQSTGIEWRTTYTQTGATETALGSGNANTNTIVSLHPSGIYAAKICYDLVLDGYGDWYLPSYDELNKLYVNKAAMALQLTTIGVLASVPTSTSHGHRPSTMATRTTILNSDLTTCAQFGLFNNIT